MASGTPRNTLTCTASRGLAEVLFVHLTYFFSFSRTLKYIKFCNSFENNEKIDKYLHKYKKELA